MGCDVHHRPHKRKQGDAKEARGREDLNEIRQADEGLVAKSGCIGVGKGEPNSVQHRIEGEDSEGKHRWCDVEMR